MKLIIQEVNKSKAFTLVELLVVIAIIGIIGAMAFPNLRNYLVERETRSAVYDILVMIDEVKNEVYNGPYAMGILDFRSNSANGVSASVKYRSQELFNSNKNCNAAGSWLSNPPIKSNTYKDLKSSKSSSPLCISKEGVHTFSDNNLIFCNSGTNTGATCGTSYNNSTYRVDWNRLGNYEVYKYNEAQKNWILQR